MRENRPVELSGEDFASGMGPDREHLGPLEAPRRMWSITVPMEIQDTLKCCSSRFEGPCGITV